MAITEPASFPIIQPVRQQQAPAGDPLAALRGKVELTGDIVSPTVEPGEWDGMRAAETPPPFAGFAYPARFEREPDGSAVNVSFRDRAPRQHGGRGRGEPAPFAGAPVD